MGALDGRGVVVTGSGRGIGADYARAVAAHGGRVVVNDLDQDVVDAVVGSITAAGGEAVGHVADVSRWDAAEALMDACVSAFGSIDGLINNAGLFRMNRVDEMEEDEVRTLVDANILGTAFCGSHAIRRMLARGRGSVVNVTSGAHTGIPTMGVYGATKGAVASFTYGWAAELHGTGVRVNAISPLGRTRMVDTTARYLESKGQPMYPGETPPPHLNAPVAVFLLSDRSSGVNGQIVRIEATQLALYTHPAICVPILQRAEWTYEAVAEAFEQDLAHRQQPTGIIGLKVEATSLASAFWDASTSGPSSSGCAQSPSPSAP